MDVGFDIETMRNGALIGKLPEPEVSLGNLKDPAKIEEKKAAVKAEQIEKMALSPIWGRMCSYAIAGDGVEHSAVIAKDTDSAETDLLEQCFSQIREHRIITYNGNGFDLPFLFRRAVILGVDPREWGIATLAELTQRYNNSWHVDLMTVWAGYNGREKLENVATAVLGDHKQDIDFREFPELIRTAEGQKKIMQYNLQDTILTLQLFNRFDGVLC